MFLRELGQVSSELLPLCHKHIGVRAGGGASAPPVTEILKFFGQNADDSGKSSRKKYSKRLSKPDLKATFSDVCLVKTELKSNDLRIQVFVLEKPYIVYMCITEIHEMKQG